MVKKLVVLVSFFLLVCGTTWAETLDIGDVASKIPFKEGIAYSIKDNAVNFLSTIEVLKFKDVALELGTAGDSEEGNWKAVAVASYPILKLEKYLDVPILKYVELNVGAYVGVGNITFSKLRLDDYDNRLDYGLSATLISLKF